MEVFRICKEAHAHVLSSSGSANRWNTKGQQVIYTGSSRSLASLELVVHRGAIQPSTTYKVMVISIADDDYLIKQVQSKDLPANWRTLAGYSALQTIGSNWYNSQESLVLKVPSAIIVRTEDYFWDSRLL
jgi:RES domain-containing protein